MSLGTEENTDAAFSVKDVTSGASSRAVEYEQSIQLVEDSALFTSINRENIQKNQYQSLQSISGRNKYGLNPPHKQF